MATINASKKAIASTCCRKEPFTKSKAIGVVIKDVKQMPCQLHLYSIKMLP
jgi:hypothetical protein